MSFENVKKLGSGTFGSVWECKTPKNKSYCSEHPTVAIKRVSNPDKHAEMEVKVLKKLNHKGCIKFLDSFRDTTTGDLCLVQEFCDLGDLSSEKGSRLEYAVWRFIGHLAGALVHIHSLNILHRDIKPANILKKTDVNGCVIKLADFGVANLMNKVHYGMLYTRGMAGTPIYMAPEVLSDIERYGKPCDIWSLGAVISFYCNGVHLFNSPNEVKAWKGGKSTLDRSRYSIDLRQLTANMLNPNASMRPTASEIWSEVNKDGRTAATDAEREQMREEEKRKKQEAEKKNGFAAIIGGAVAGTATGALAGPVGAGVGALVGAMAGLGFAVKNN